MPFDKTMQIKQPLLTGILQPVMDAPLDERVKVLAAGIVVKHYSRMHDRLAHDDGDIDARREEIRAISPNKDSKSVGEFPNLSDELIQLGVYEETVRRVYARLKESLEKELCESTGLAA